MSYISDIETATKSNISQRRLTTSCSENRVPGETMNGNVWFVPSNTEKRANGKYIDASERDKRALKPFVKWAGGKGQLLEEIRKKYPRELGKSINKYAEPFVGGGAVLFDILSNYKLKEVYISDINAELINAYKVIRDNVSELVKQLEILQEEYIPMDTDERKHYYYQKRDRYNDMKINGGNNVEKAALFIFLNKTCFNGLYRVNRKGQFNVPIGAYKKPLICDKKNLVDVSAALQNVEIVCGDFKESYDFIDSNTFVYFDPPYRPLNETSNFTSYTENNFDDKAQIELAEYVDKLDNIGAKVIVSNSDPKNWDSNDNFFEKLYQKHKIVRVQASRMINCNASLRGKISELLITNY